MNRKLPWINAVGCAILMCIVVMQWWQGENRRDAYLQLQRQSNVFAEQRDDAMRRADSFQADLEELKKSLLNTQVAADQASLAKKNTEADVLRLQQEREQWLQQIAAWKKQATEWERALQQRDAALAERNAALVEMRKKLDEAIAQLKKAGAR